MKGTLEKKRTWANNQAFGPLLKFDPILGDIKKSFDTIYDSLNNGSRPLKTSFHVIVSENPKRKLRPRHRLRNPSGPTSTSRSRKIGT